MTLAIRSVETGEVREISPKLTRFDDGQWSPDGRWFLTHGRDVKGRSGIFQIDAETGDALPLVIDDAGEGTGYPASAPDGKGFYFPRLYRATRDRALISETLRLARSGC